MDEKQTTELFRGLGRIESLVNEQGKRLDRQGSILERNTITVEEHKQMSINLKRELDQVKADVAPIKKHVYGVQWFLNAIKWAGVIFGTFAGGYGVYHLITVIIFSKG